MQRIFFVVHFWFNYWSEGVALSADGFLLNLCTLVNVYLITRLVYNYFSNRLIMNNQINCFSLANQLNVLMI